MLQNLASEGGNPVVACKYLRVTDYDGRHVGTVQCSTVAINPNIREAEDLARWYVYYTVHTAVLYLLTSLIAIYLCSDEAVGRLLYLPYRPTHSSCDPGSLITVTNSSTALHLVVLSLALAQSSWKE